LDAKERQRLIETYRDGYRTVADALEGIPDDELDRSAEDGWTPRQIVHHLADSEMEGATRIRRLLALRSPTILGYDEKAFAPLAGASDRTVARSLSLGARDQPAASGAHDRRRLAPGGDAHRARRLRHRGLAEGLRVACP
jgi:hypothetical protein